MVVLYQVLLYLHEAVEQHKRDNKYIRRTNKIKNTNWEQEVVLEAFTGKAASCLCAPRVELE